MNDFTYVKKHKTTPGAGTTRANYYPGKHILFLLVVSTLVCLTMLFNYDIKSRTCSTVYEKSLLLPCSAETVHFFLNTSVKIHTTSYYFLSLAMDSSRIRNGLKNPRLSNPKLIKLVSYLSPGYLRIGGTDADLLVFNLTKNNIWARRNTQEFKEGQNTNWSDLCNLMNNATQGKKCFEMSAKEWDEICTFANATQHRLLFDLNVLLRSGSQWNSSNAELLLDYSREQGFTNIDFQLGNEPNSFHHVFGVELPAEVLATDYVRLRQLLDQYTFAGSKIVGPEVTRPKLPQMPSEYYFADFVAGAKHAISALSWHHYYMGPDATVENFLDPVIYDFFERNITVFKEIAANKGVGDMPMWLSETGSTYHGGAANLSDRFVASFLWLDKLGTAARCGLDVVIRQSICRGNYALLDTVTQDPNPDWWVSLLYKRLVAPIVLNITQTSWVKVPTMRLYAHCSRNNSIIVFGVNLANRYEHMGIAPYGNQPITASRYILTSYGGLQSRHLKLNGKMLQLGKNNRLPKLKPVSVDFQKPITIPPLAIIFLDIHNLTTPVCIHEAKER